MRRVALLLFLGALWLTLGGCSKADVCETCDDDNDCKDELNCAEMSDGSFRCVSHPWETCTVKSHLTAP